MRKYTREEVIAQAIEVHGDINTYENFVYVNTMTKTMVTCKIHGDFPVTPHEHVKKKSGCPHCWQKRRTEHLWDTKEDYVEKANIKHDNLYTYNNFIYQGNKVKGDITCKIHGDFPMRPNNHLSGQGCPHCAKENAGFHKSDFIKASKGKPATLYVLKVFSENEEFYKIGITTQKIKNRFQKGNIPYEYEILYEFRGDAGIIYDLENEVLRQLKEYKYQPETPFAGQTECFKDIELKEIILKITINN